VSCGLLLVPLGGFLFLGREDGLLFGFLVAALDFGVADKIPVLQPIWLAYAYNAVFVH
jgi:hypothetical protein